MRIETPRLIIRELEDDDIDFVAEMLAHPEVMRYWPHPHTREESEQWIARQRQRYQDHGHGYWLAIAKESGQPIGQVGALRSIVDGVEEENIGYILHRPFWGKGYATEGAKACLAYLQQHFPIADPAILIRPENGPSMRVAERLGFEIERTTQYAGLTHHVLRMT